MPDPSLEQILQAALARHQAGQIDQAASLYRQILAREPNHPHALHLLGVTAAQSGRDADAEPLIRRAIELHPQFPEAWTNLGGVLKHLDRLDEAIACFQHALALKPDEATTLSNLGFALRDRGRLEEAMDCCRRAIELEPNHPEALSNLGTILDMQGRFREGLECFRRAVAAAPDFANAHINLAYSFLRLGEFENGWPEYEWRFQHNPSLRRDFALPRWDGSDLRGRRILVHAEQGFGDTIQFARFVPLVAQRGGRVVLECHAPLVGLLQSVAGVEQVIPHGQAPAPAVDLQCPLMSVPLALGVTRQTIPADVPYLHADPQLTRAWQDRLKRDPARLKIGVVWHGRPTYKHNAERSVPLSLLAPLAEVPDVSFYSVQKGDAAQQAAQAPIRLTDWTGELSDFASTAAFMSALDMIITVDTAVAHLAGAFGRPVWMMLSLLREWRWLTETDRSPWYPTMRVFLQRTSGDWEELISRVRAALSDHAAGAGGVTSRAETG